jgi:hypothetical protein
MTRIEPSRCVRWRLGWLPGGVSRPHPLHPSQALIKFHYIHCLNMQRRLQLPETVSDHLSFLLNKSLTEYHVSFKQSLLNFFDGWPFASSSMSLVTYAMKKFRPQHRLILGKDPSIGVLFSLTSVSYTCLRFFLPKRFIFDLIRSFYLPLISWSDPGESDENWIIMHLFG